TQLAFGQQVSNTTAGSSMSPSPTVKLLDVGGNPTTSTSQIVLSITTNPCGGSPTVSGGTTSAISGTATFSSLQITKACNGYVLTATDATDGGITVASGTFNITAAGLDHFAFAAATPQTDGVAFTGTNTLTAQDVYGNTVTNFNASTDNVTVTALSPLTGTVSGIHGSNVLNASGDFVNGVANLTSLG